ncbi:MAG: TonB-dependent receptor plug domain-containing protein [Bacteroidia bacterium]
MKFNHIMLAVVFFRLTSNTLAQTPDTLFAYPLRETVISATRFEQSAGSVAQPFSVVDSSRIASAQAQTTADLLASESNLHVQKSQAGGGSMVLRGFEASRILLVIDGIRMNNLIYRSGHLQNIITTDNNALDRVEVMYGPSSTMYGSDALGGVIHLFTKKPAFADQSSKGKFRGSVMSRYASANNAMTGNLQLFTSLPRVASFTSFTWSEFGDIRGGKSQNMFYDSTYGTRPLYVKRFGDRDSLLVNSKPELQIGSAYNQYDLVQRILFRSNKHVTHGLNVQYSNSSDVPRYDRLTDPDGVGGLKFAEWYYGPQTRFMLAYDIDAFDVAKTSSKTRLSISRQWIEESRYTRRFNNPSLQSRIEKVQVTALSITRHVENISHSASFGIDAQYEDLQSKAKATNIITQEISPIDTRYPGGDNSMMQSAAFWSHTWKWNRKLELVDGLRLGISQLKCEFNDTSFFPFPYTEAKQSHLVWSASLGLVHRLSGHTRQSMLISSGFRVPNVDDLSKVFESQPGFIIVPNPDIAPEKTYNIDWSLQHYFGNNGQASINGFYTEFADAIVVDEFIFNGSDSILYEGQPSVVLAPQNKRSAYLYGASIRFIYPISRRFNSEASASYTYGRIRTDSVAAPLDHIPPVMAALRLQYESANSKFKCSFKADFNGWKRLKEYYLNGEDNEQYATPEGMPAWMVYDVNASMEPNAYWKVSCGINNILDTQYRTFASGINAPGRSLMIALRYAF